MINPIDTEEGLISDLSDRRHAEMFQYGRVETFKEINHYLEGDFCRAFILVNHVPAILDDLIDADGNRERLAEAKNILSASFNNSDKSIAEGWSKHIGELGRVLAKMDNDGFKHAKQLRDEVLKYWAIEEKNLDRRGQILSAKDLKDLNMNIGKSVGLQFLHLLTPELDEGQKENIAESYGLAIKSADNLSDLDQDLEVGFVNISRENIEKYNLDVTKLNRQDLQPYLASELERINRCYNLSDECLDKVTEENPSYHHALLLFKKVAHSWLIQVKEKYE